MSAYSFYRNFGFRFWLPEYFKRLLSIYDCNLTAAVSNSTNCTRGSNNVELYQDVLFTAIASVGGSIAGIILINVIGGRIQLCKL